MEIMCPLCSQPASMAIVNQLTFTICGDCGHVHVAESDSYVRMDLYDVQQLMSGRGNGTYQLLVVAKAMQTLYENWSDIVRM